MENKDVEERWGNYRKANFEKPSARENELRKIFSLLNPQIGEKIWEVGTGNGYLTFPVAEAVGNAGEVVTTDVSEGNINDVIEKNSQKGLPIKVKLLPIDSPLPDEKYINYFDAVTNIGTLHHYDNRKKNTGESGRIEIIGQFFKTLKNGGRLVMADPLYGTITQKYFDAIDNPINCHPDGHPHDFPTKERLQSMLEEIGFKNISIEVINTPWKFNSVEEAMNFVHTIHNAKCTSEASFEVAKNILDFKKVNDHYELGWELFFVTAWKK